MFPPYPKFFLFSFTKIGLFNDSISFIPLGLKSKLSFINTNTLGEIITHCVDVDKSFEGKMLMFNSIQSHMVYPFYTSDDYRITISGNLKFKVK